MADLFREIEGAFTPGTVVPSRAVSPAPVTPPPAPTPAYTGGRDFDMARKTADSASSAKPSLEPPKTTLLTEASLRKMPPDEQKAALAPKAN